MKNTRWGKSPLAASIRRESPADGRNQLEKSPNGGRLPLFVQSECKEGCGLDSSAGNRDARLAGSKELKSGERKRSSEEQSSPTKRNYGGTEEGVVLNREEYKQGECVHHKA